MNEAVMWMNVPRSICTGIWISFKIETINTHPLNQLLINITWQEFTFAVALARRVVHYVNTNGVMVNWLTRLHLTIETAWYFLFAYGNYVAPLPANNIFESAHVLTWSNSVAKTFTHCCLNSNYHWIFTGVKLRTASNEATTLCFPSLLLLL